MKRLFIIAIIMMAAIHCWAQAGKWNFYLSYYEVSDVQPAGNTIFFLASGALFTYNVNDESIYEYSQGNGLSSNNIKHIAWCKNAQQLVIIYDNLDIDLLDIDGNITNISSYKNKSTTDNKAINDVFIEGPFAYIATGFGVVKMNVQKQFIENTYRLGNNITQIAAADGFIYGMCPDKNAFFIGDQKLNLIDSNNWRMASLPSGNNAVRQELCVSDGHFISFSERRDTLLIDENGRERKYYQNVFEVNRFLFNNNSIGLENILQLKDDPVRNIYYKEPVYTLSLSGGHIFFLRDNKCYDVDASGYKILDLPGVASIFYDSTHKCYWATSTEDNSLQQMTINTNSGEEQTGLTVTRTGIKANGPKYNYYYSLRNRGGSIIGTDGGLSGNPTQWMSETLGRKPCIQLLNADGTWTVMEDDIKQYTNISYFDICSADIDPLDSTHIAACSRSGVYEFKDGKFLKHWTITNSPLTSALSNNLQYVEVTGIVYDDNGDLWVLNGYVDNILFKLTHDGEWQNLTPAFFVDMNDSNLRNPRHPQFDSKGRLWFCIDHSWLPAIYCYDPKTEELLSFQKPFQNQDGVTLNIVDGIHAIQLDKDENVWVGTDVGLFVLMADDANSQNKVFTQVKIPRNDGTNFADYLLADINISSIAIDAANRKWIGTNGNGVYLVNSDNTEVLQHFTTNDSPLLSDAIEAIAINAKRGEVFFGTANGLCSYMSDVTHSYDELTEDNVYAYPNPVQPDYTGPITVTGLTMNADVKIVTPNGKLVAQGRSTSGNFTWDGCDMSGKRVASGVYMVLTATAEGKKGVVCKIAIVR